MELVTTMRLQILRVRNLGPTSATTKTAFVYAVFFLFIFVFGLFKPNFRLHKK